MMKKISTHKICVFLPMMVLALLFLWVKPVSAYAADYSKIDPTRSAKLKGFVNFADGYTPYTDGRVHGDRGNLEWADDLWLSGICLNLDNGGYDGGIEYALHTHNYAWTRTAKGGEYINSQIENNGRTYGSHAWTEAITCQLYNGVSNYYYIDYYGQSTRCTEGYLYMWSENKTPSLHRQWENGAGYHNQTQDPGKTMSEDTADMTNWNGQNWVGTTGMGMPLTGFSCELRRRKGDLEVNPNGGTWNGSTNSTTLRYDTDGSFTIKNPTRDGYEFTGWTLTYTSAGGADDSNNYQAPASNDYPHVGATIYTASQGRGVSVGKDLNSSKALYVGNMKNIALTANWKKKAVPKYTVTCIDHHVDGTTTTRTKSNVESGTSVGGWSTFGTDCKTGEEYDHDDDWKTVTGNTTLNIYYKGKQYVCTFDPNGGTLVGDRTHTFTYYSTANCLGRSTAKRAGWTFQGWYGTATGGSKVFDENGDWYDKNTNKASWTGWLTGSSWYYNNVRTAKWVLASNATVYAHWGTNTYRLYVDLNKGSGSTTPNGTSGYYDMQYNSTKNLGTPSREGYSFAGWKIVEDKTSGSSLSGSTFKMGYHKDYPNKSYTNSYAVKVQAQWTANKYVIRFDGNGAESGNVDCMTVNYDTNIILPANGYILARNTFVGWTHNADEHVGTYVEGQEMLSSIIIDAAGMKNQNNAEIVLYCAWDSAPNITANSKSFTLEEAKNGMITEDRLFENVCAMDEILDQEILPGVHELSNGRTNSFVLTNYSQDEFTLFNDSGSASITYRAIDSVGNITEETITVYIVDNTPQEPLSGEGTYRVRFISGKYYDKPEEEGGLMKDSIWRTDPEYAGLLGLLR